MQAVLAIALLTVKAALRFRLVPVLAVLLAGAVVLLPAVIKDDGTARGLTQIVLTYTLGLITAVLGLVTLWLGCGTLARDVEECQIQLVVVKPVARWQVWVGKWLGVMLLNAALLVFCAGAVYIELVWRARSLPAKQQEVLRSEIFVARGSAKPEVPNFDSEVERLLQERLKNPNVEAMDRNQVRKIIREQIKATLQVVPSGYRRTWELQLDAPGYALRDQPMFLRVKFFASEKARTETYTGLWEIGPPEGINRARVGKSQAAETFHEFPIPPNMFDDQGKLTISFYNENPMALLFPLEDGLEVLYREGGFALNYFQGVAIVFCWLALLAALGLAAGSFLTFPVAAFVALSLLVVSFSTTTMRQVIEQGTVFDVDSNTGKVGEATWVDHATVGFFRGALAVVNVVRDFSPIDSLSSGRTVGWGQLARAVAQIVLLVGGLFAALGIATFTRRELATAQSKL